MWGCFQLVQQLEKWQSRAEAESGLSLGGAGAHGHAEGGGVERVTVAVVTEWQPPCMMAGMVHGVLRRPPNPKYPFNYTQRPYLRGGAGVTRRLPSVIDGNHKLTSID